MSDEATTHDTQQSKPKRKRTRAKPLSLYPLTFEEAQAGLLAAGPMPGKAEQKAKARAKTRAKWEQQKKADMPTEVNQVGAAASE